MVDGRHVQLDHLPEGYSSQAIESSGRPGQRSSKARTQGFPSQWPKTVSWAVVVLAITYLGMYAVVASLRLPYPFELEWMEGGSVCQVQRILDGRAIYVKPSLDFVPYIYTPLYYYASAAVALLTGNGFFPLRLVSFASSIGCFVFIFLIVGRRTLSYFPSFVACGLFAATFRISGAWFDVGRVDSLFLLFLLAGIYAYESPNRFARSLISPILLVLSFFTKQTALIVAVALSAGAVLFRKRWERVLFPLIFGGLVGGACLAINQVTEGWFGYYVFKLPAEHDVARGRTVMFWLEDLIPHLSIASCFSLLPFLRAGAWQSQRNRLIGDALLFGSLIVAAWSSRLHTGGYDNVLMPGYAAIAIYAGTGLHLALRTLGRIPSVRLVITLATAFQFLNLFYWPHQQVPSRADREQGEKLIELVSSIPGQVCWPNHPWYLALADKPTQAQGMAISDILRARKSHFEKALLERDITEAILHGRYEAIVLDSMHFLLPIPEFDSHYYLANADLTGQVFHPVTGVDQKPTCLYVRRTDQSAAAGGK